MPNIKSSSKRALLSKKAAERNKSVKSRIKTNIKKFDAATTAGDRESAEGAFRAAVKSVDRAATKGLIHKNKAARRKSALARKLNGIAADLQHDDTINTGLSEHGGVSSLYLLPAVICWMLPCVCIIRIICIACFFVYNRMHRLCIGKTGKECASGV